MGNVAKSDSKSLELGDWKRFFTPDQYHVTRLKITEKAGGDGLNNADQNGTSLCSNCENPAFYSATKYDAATCWPLFSPLQIKLQLPCMRTTALRARTEAYCTICIAHFDHVFDDGLEPTGLCYSLNGVSLKFQSTYE